MVKFSIEKLNIWFGSTRALKDVSLEIQANEILSVIGPSNSGKTSFLRTLNRLNELNAYFRMEGTVLLDGKNIREVDQEVLRKKIGIIFALPLPLPLSIFDNVAYGPRIHGLKKRKVINQTVIKYLQYVGLWDEVRGRVRSSASRLSIGQQQRLCLARGLAIEPEYILGDEATSALDPLSTKKIEELFIRLKEKYTVILVTHTLRQAKRIADNIVFMYLGKIVESGPTEEFFNNPKKQLTRDYLSGSFS